MEDERPSGRGEAGPGAAAPVSGRGGTGEHTPAHGPAAGTTPPTFHEMWRDLRPIGRSRASGGYRRYAWTPADADCRAWFRAQAETRGLTYEVDRNGNQWAWLGDPAAGDAVVTGSHLDSVPDGGAFDGPLGIVTAFAALDDLRATAASGTPRLARPLGIVNFGDEEGARFGLACVGSRLAAGRLTRAQAHALRDADGVSLPEAMAAAGHDPEAIGPDPERLARIGAFVELHVEQGRALDLSGDPIGIASAIWPHGRWRFDFRGEANHAGTTRLADRRDPMLPYAETVLAARREAELAGALATFGKVAVEPNGVNAIPSLVSGWLDSRAADQPTLDALVGAVERAAREHAERHGVDVAVVRESSTPVVEFQHALRDEIGRILTGNGNGNGDGDGDGHGIGRRTGAGLLTGRDDRGRPEAGHGATRVPVLPTGAGHDAGILSGTVPTAMLFVRNPTGVSHSPAEHAREEDCLAGVRALAKVLNGLAGSRTTARSSG